MVSLWGGKTDEAENEHGHAAASSSQRSHENEGERQADEHTRLLPNRVESTSYLSPDDPAVSPYNLWSVRLVRYFTIFLTFVTFGWWVIMLVGMFVTPPGFHVRGSGFFPFSYTSLTLANLLITLIFFAVPARSVRILSVIMSFLLLIDTIVLLAVERTRHEEGWVGMISVVWALVLAIWILVTDRLVLWGKREEEERLTGRPETRRTLGEWTAVLIATVAMLIMTIIVFLITCTLILRAVDASLAPPGELHWVDGNRYLMHVYCKGERSDLKGNKLPTVLIEGGEGTVEDGLWQFAENALKNGSINRYCFVDRPGVGWSDTAPSPLSAGMAVEVAGEALARAGEEGPYVLLGAGVGSIYSRIFSARHGGEVRGLVLVDPLHEDFLGPRIGGAGRGFQLWIRGVISPLGLDRVSGALFRGRTKEDRVWGRAAYQSGKSIFSKLQENLVADSLTRRDVSTSRAIQFKDVPITIISSGVEIRQDSEWEAKQRDLTHLTSELRDWDVVSKAPHEVWTTLEGREIIERRLKQMVHAK